MSSTAIIVRNELMEQCVTAGRVVERTVKEQLLNNRDPLTDAKLEEVFEPVVKYVEERTEVRIRKEIDEVEALVKEKKRQQDREDERTRVYNEVEGRVVLKVNGKRKKRIKKDKVKRFKKAIVKEQLLPEFTTAVVEEFQAKEALSDLEDDDKVMRIYTWSPHWDKYCAEINIKVDKPADKMVTDNAILSKFGKYLCSPKQKNCFSITEITKILEKIEATLGDAYDRIPPTIELLKQTNVLLQTDNITLDQLFVFMKELNSGDDVTREFIISAIAYIHNCQHHQQEPEEKVLCGAYDCFDELEEDELYEGCKESDCEVKICDECSEQGRDKCEAHR